MSMEEFTLFDPPNRTRYPKPAGPYPSDLSPGRRATMRRRATIAKGFHPVTRKKLLTGEDRVCSDCEHFKRVSHRAKSYFKCFASNGLYVTRGPGTDLRVSDPACAMFKDQDEGS